MVEFTLPAIDEKAGRQEQARQIRAYLYQLTEQLRVTLSALEGDTEANAAASERLRLKAEANAGSLTEAFGRLGILGKDRVIQSNEAPSHPETGTIWLDTGGEHPAYYRYDGSDWIPITDYEREAGTAERVTRIEQAVSEEGIASLVSRSESIGDVVRSIVSTAFIQGASGLEARMTRVEQGTQALTDWIRWTAYKGETGLMIGTDNARTWVFITHTALRVMDGDSIEAQFSLNRAEMRDALTENGLSFGNGEAKMRIDWNEDTGLTIRPN